MGTPGLTSHKETSSGNTRKQLWDFLASEAGAVMEEGVLPLAFVRGHQPKEKLRGPVASFKILIYLGGSYQTLPGSMGMKTNPDQHFDRRREVSRPQVRKAEKPLQTIAQDRDSTPDSEVVRDKRDKEKNSLSGKEVAIFDQSSSNQDARVLHLDEAVNLDMPLDQTQEVQPLVKEPTGWQQHRGKSTDESLATTVGDAIKARFCLNLHHLPAAAPPSLCTRPGLLLEHSSKDGFQGEPEVRDPENSWQTGTTTKEVGSIRPEGEKLCPKRHLPFCCWCEDTDHRRPGSNDLECPAKDAFKEEREEREQKL